MNKSENHVGLNYRVPPKFAKQFKLAALESDMKQNELLYYLLKIYKHLQAMDPAYGHLRQRTMVQELGVDSLDKSGGDMTLYADDGVRVVGRNVEKQAVNFRLEKPLLDLIDTQAEYLGVKKADLVRLALWQLVQRNNIANQASKVEGEQRKTNK